MRRDWKKLEKDLRVEEQAQAVEVALVGNVTEYLEYELDGLLVLHQGQLPKPHEVDRCLEVCMRAIGLECHVQPTPPSDGEGVLHARLSYRTKDGNDIMMVDIQLVATP